MNSVRTLVMAYIPAKQQRWVHSMRNDGTHHGHFIGLFDVLGFETRLLKWGLGRMTEAYVSLIASIEARETHMTRLFGEMGFREAPYWTSDGDIFIFNRIGGAFASDSILVWANRTWPEARNKSADELAEIAADPARGWVAHPIPCDNFIDACNDLICHSIEVGLPLRGAVSMGPAVIDNDRRIFLGQPIVDAARMERGQTFLGASVCRSFTSQVLPARYGFPYEAHLKSPTPSVWGGLVLDWPRHWRKTRRDDSLSAVAQLDTDPKFAHYYDATRQFIAASEQIDGKFESPAEVSLRSVYAEFGHPELMVPARAVRRVPIKL